MREPIHPGETLRENVDALGMSPAELPRPIEVPVNRITQILHGRRATTDDTELRLGRFFGTSGEYLAHPPEALRAAACGAQERRGERPAAHPRESAKDMQHFPSDCSINSRQAVTQRHPSGANRQLPVSGDATGRPIPVRHSPGDLASGHLAHHASKGLAPASAKLPMSGCCG